MPDLGDFLRRLADMAQADRPRPAGQPGLSDRPFTSTESLSLEAGMDDIRAVMDAAGDPERAVLFGSRGRRLRMQPVRRLVP